MNFILHIPIHQIYQFLYPKIKYIIFYKFNIIKFTLTWEYCDNSISLIENTVNNKL